MDVDWKKSSVNGCRFQSESLAADFLLALPLPEPDPDLEPDDDLEREPDLKKFLVLTSEQIF